MKTIFQIMLMGLIFATSITACKKDKQGNTTVSAYDYVPLKTGNYWAFDIKEVDSLGNLVSYIGTDTFRVLKDTIIQSKTYYWLAGTQASGLCFYKLQNNWLTDSAGYLINPSGKRFLSTSNFNDTIEVIDDSWIGSYTLKTFFRMTKVSNTLTVPAGTFQVINSQGSVYFEQQGSINNKRKMNNYFAKEVGFVSSSVFYIDSQNDVVANLTGFSIQ